MGTEDNTAIANAVKLMHGIPEPSVAVTPQPSAEFPERRIWLPMSFFQVFVTRASWSHKRGTAN